MMTIRRIVVFSKDHCSACHTLKGALKQLGDFPVEIHELESDPDLFEEWEVTKFPTTFLLENDEISDRMQGVSQRIIQNVHNFALPTFDE